MTGMKNSYCIGSERWNGLSKLVEECGEVVQVAGKLLGTNGEVRHWDGSNLRERMTEELADLQAAITFFIRGNDFDADEFQRRAVKKLELFRQWDGEQKG